MLWRAMGAGAILLAIGCGSALAAQRIERGGFGPTTGELPRHSCYRVTYVPALYLVDTRGKLVKPERVVWEGDIADGSEVRRKRIPATYLQTRKLLAEDHYTLVRIPCRD